MINTTWDFSLTCWHSATQVIARGGPREQADPEHGLSHHASDDVHPEPCSGRAMHWTGADSRRNSHKQIQAQFFLVNDLPATRE